MNSLTPLEKRALRPEQHVIRLLSETSPLEKHSLGQRQGQEVTEQTYMCSSLGSGQMGSKLLGPLQVMNFDRSGKMVRHGTFGEMKAK